MDWENVLFHELMPRVHLQAFLGLGVSLKRKRKPTSNVHNSVSMK